MLLAIVIWGVTGVVTAGFATKRWWFPAPINTHAAAFDSYFSANLIFSGIVFLAAQLALGWLIWRHRNRGQQAVHSDGNNRMELLWTSLTAILFLGAAIGSARMWSDVHLSTFSTTPMRIEASGKQFAWNFRYPGADGKFGKTDARLANDAAGNPAGILPDDPAGKDDIVNAALRIPAGRPVQLILRSNDVLHNFFVRELRVKQDLVPGLDIPLHILADKPGEYEIACSELCGLGHHQMRSVMIVLPQPDFDSWLGKQAAK
ncbi:MAG: cupredoxin domain-containing protein [Acidobacteria bacterium]|nr:cupredoxin domain-containing protein [Acidobacteriota bacterium]